MLGEKKLVRIRQSAFLIVFRQISGETHRVAAPHRGHGRGGALARDAMGGGARDECLATSTSSGANLAGTRADANLQRVKLCGGEKHTYRTDWLRRFTPLIPTSHPSWAIEPHHYFVAQAYQSGLTKKNIVQKIWYFRREILQHPEGLGSKKIEPRKLGRWGVRDSPPPIGGGGGPGLSLICPSP